ncbi:hypothetical protein [Planctomicrobium piriforme]|uniref:Uncharacterized protein n=1 Tax=Planctomicrobium piriforme TaxID=1576369 RepID=A0A1I3ELL6_9PLAN|nr:hypothetical protein [Planctomicrobium piriforme]SFH99710.1 hypothetical protein SAMN05421753_104273 [Planctomicrobium piriforme]
MPQMPSGSNPVRRIASFAAAVAAVATVWLVVLPAAGNRADVRGLIERNERLGIDPSAKFYTELPGMQGFLDNIDSALRRHGESFWGR